MPVNVRRGKSKYEYRTPAGKVLALCPLDALQSEVWAAYEQAVTQSAPTVDNLAKGYFESREFCRRRPKTQAGYRASWKTLEPVWSGVDATKVRPVHIRQYMDERGPSGEIAANREYSLLRNIFAWAFERGKVKLNPCIGVKKFPEKPREKYITDEEYYPFLELSRPAVQVLMELSYLCAARGQDIRSLTLSQIQDDGIFIRQGKTGKKQIKLWTPRLRDAVALAMKLRDEILHAKPGIVSPYLIVTGSATPYTESGLKSLWAKNRAAVRAKMAAAAGVPPEKIVIDWTFHDIKAKAISDFEGDKQKFSGHRSVRQMQDYDRKTQLAPTLETGPRPLQR
jgi:integrase